MNIQQLRQSLKMKWLSYYEQNRSWLGTMRVWGTYNGLRRPSSGFILATLSVLESQLNEILPFILDLNDNPDQIITALGLNFNPDEELRLVNLESSLTVTQIETKSAQEKDCEHQPVPLVAVAPKIPAYAPTEITHSEPLSTEVLRLPQPVSSMTATNEVVGIHKTVSSVAVATKVAPPPVPKSPMSLLRQHQPLRSPLAITIDLPSKVKVLPKPEIKDSRLTYIPIKFWTLLLKTNCLVGTVFLCQFSNLPGDKNGNHAKHQPQEIARKVPSTSDINARSLASWIDESCQGKEYEREAVSIR
ncbi:MAG: DUF5331 domain-containing protein [Nostoc sp. LLA-1]|nr:DUF5331 domain-containing protein [Cyanocohniella sp. LLY]